MKKAIAITLTILLLLTMAACGNKAEETAPTAAQPTTAPLPEATEASEPTQATEPIPEQTTEPTIPAPTEPEWEPGTILASYGETVYRTFQAGTQLKVIGRFLGYYVVEQEDIDLLVTMDMLRMEGEEAPESWAGYTKSGTEVFTSPYMRGEPISTLPENTQITVLDSSDSWAYIEWAEGKGYADPAMLSKWRITGGNADRYNDGTDVPVGSLTSTDAVFQPHIHPLGAYYGPEMEKDFTGGMATVLADGTEGYIRLLERDTEVKVTSYDDQTATLWLGEELYGTLPRFLVKLEGDEAYTSWTGYAKWGSIVYGEYQLDTQMAVLSVNSQVTVLDEIGGRYVVEYEGQTGYMQPGMVSQTPNSTGGGASDTWSPPEL